jgi:GTPase SAR1 family protein
MEKIDASYKIFETILEEIKAYDHTIFSEQDSRIKIIDRVLIEVLHYSFESFVTESKAGKGFIDYKVNVNNIPKLLIEAKKDGLDFNIDKSYSGRAFNLNGPVFKDKVIQEGLDQAIYYAAHKGIETACLTNGKTWIIFRANRLGDGKDVLEGKGFVFSSLEAIKNEFKLFYELLSPENISDLKYRAIFQEAEGDEIRVKEFSKALKDEESIRILERDVHSQDFDRVMTEFFSKLSGDTDPDMLVECFVETKESKGAEEELHRISEDLINRVKSLDTREAEVLKDLIERIKTTNRHEFVILIGGKGAGKSTFIERFFKIVLEQKLRDSCIVIRINVAESEGYSNTIVDWLNHTLLEECEKVLFNGKPTYEEIVGMFFFEYERLSTGPWKGIYEKDKDQFKIDFGKHVEERRENRPNEYIKRMIGDITKSRKKVPCLIFDNTDHFSIDFQENVFQYARSIYEKEICLVIVPVTDKTSWQLSKQGAIQSFENEALFLPTPLPKKIIEKRIEFLEKKIEIENTTKGQYFLSRGIKLEIQSIEGFVKYLQGIFLKDPNVAKWVGSFSNFDIRRSLDLTKDIIASPHLSLDEFLKVYTYNKENKDEVEAPIKPYRIKNALIKKFYDCYPLNHHTYIQNLFYFTNNVNTSPLLALRILQVLVDRKNDMGEDNFLSVDQLLDYFNGMGIDRSITLKHLDLLLKKGLILSYDPTVLWISDSKRVELSASGFEHYFWGLNDNDYLFAMLEVTSITDQTFYDLIEREYRYWDAKNTLMIEFLYYLGKEDKIYCHIPEHISYKGQHVIFKRFAWRRDLIKKWMSKERTH